MSTACSDFICFVNLDPTGPKIFGFSEFLAGLALMVLAWTIADTRYKFRIKTAPFPLEKITFGVISLIGILSLLTDYWRASGLPVIKGDIISSLDWQLLLASIFLATFISWIWFAFIRPSKYGRCNSTRFNQVVYSYLIRGVDNELAIVADELSRSSKELVVFAAEEQLNSQAMKKLKDIKRIEKDAEALIGLISDRRFCRAVVNSSPAFALLFFMEVDKLAKSSSNISVFARNIFEAALLNDNSFLYHESSYYNSGLIGHWKPLSRAMFSNHEMIERLKNVFEVDFKLKNKMTPAQFEAYCRALTLTLTSYTKSKNNEFSLNSIRNAVEFVIGKSVEVYSLNGILAPSETEQVQRLKSALNLICQVCDELDNRDKQFYSELRKDKTKQNNNSIYDVIAHGIFNIIQHAGMVREPWETAHYIQVHIVYSNLVKYANYGEARKIIFHKVRRMIFDEVKKLGVQPNYVGARFLAFCLNVFGLEDKQKIKSCDFYVLQKCILSWVRRNYSKLYCEYPVIAEYCLVDTLKFDVDKSRIVKTYRTSVLSIQSKYSFLYVTRYNRLVIKNPIKKLCLRKNLRHVLSNRE